MEVVQKSEAPLIKDSEVFPFFLHLFVRYNTVTFYNNWNHILCRQNPKRDSGYRHRQPDGAVGVMILRNTYAFFTINLFLLFCNIFVLWIFVLLCIRWQAQRSEETEAQIRTVVSQLWICFFLKILTSTLYWFKFGILYCKMFLAPDESGTGMKANAYFLCHNHL